MKLPWEHKCEECEKDVKVLSVYTEWANMYFEMTLNLECGHTAWVRLDSVDKYDVS